MVSGTITSSPQDVDCLSDSTDAPSHGETNELYRVVYQLIVVLERQGKDNSGISGLLHELQKEVPVQKKTFIDGMLALLSSWMDYEEANNPDQNQMPDQIPRFCLEGFSTEKKSRLQAGLFKIVLNYLFLHGWLGSGPTFGEYLESISNGEERDEGKKQHALSFWRLLSGLNIKPSSFFKRDWPPTGVNLDDFDYLFRGYCKALGLFQ